MPEARTKHHSVRNTIDSSLFPTLALGLIILWTPLLRAQAPTSPAAAGQKPEAASHPEFRKGVLYGRVIDLDNKPVPDATVALQDKNGKVVAWTTTNAQGEYALAADPMTVLNLRPSKRRGLLEQCVRAAGDVVMAPLKVVGSAAANPGKTIQSGAVSVATGTPAPLAGQAIIASMPGRASAAQTAKAAKDLAARTALGEGPHSASNSAAGNKGQAQLLVAAHSFKDAKITAGAFWMDDPLPDKTNPVGMQAWLETVKMAPTGNAKSSDVVPEALTLGDAALDPTLVPAAGDVKIQVKLISPPGPDHRVRVFARESRKDTVVELMPKDGLFVGTLKLDPNTPAGPTTVSIAALRALPMGVKLDPKKADPLLTFVKKLDDMEAGKPYEYDPRIMASKNRLDVKLTVLPPKQGT